MSAQAVEDVTPVRETKVRQWRTEDDWIVGYSTERYGDHDRPDLAGFAGPTIDVTGLYAMHIYRPVGKGSRSGSPQEWQLVTLAPTASRTKARKWALDSYWNHCPKAYREAIDNGAFRHPITGILTASPEDV